MLPVVLSGRGVTAPDDLSPLQRELWDLVVPHVAVVLQESDAATFRGMVTALSRAVEADLVVNERGLEVTREVLNTRTGQVQRLTVENPMLKVSERSWKLYSAFADRMGMSPAARAKLGLLGAQAKTAAETLREKLGDDPWGKSPEQLGEGGDVIDQEPVEEPTDG